MTLDEAKKELSSYKHRKKALLLLEIKIKELERQANGNGSMTISDTPGVEGGQKRLMKDIINELCDLKDKYWKEYVEAEKLCSELESKIYKVGEKNVLFANILSMYYIHNLRLLDISKEIGYSYSQCKRLFNKSIIKYSKENEGICC